MPSFATLNFNKTIDSITNSISFNIKNAPNKENIFAAYKASRNLDVLISVIF